MAAGRGVKSRACLLFGIYYAQTLNPKEKAKKPKLILCPTNPPSEKLKIRYSYKKILGP